MAELSDAAKAALPFWSVIERAATEHMTTADTWAALREQAAAYGLDRPGISAAGVSALRGIAGSIQRASTELARAERDYGLTAAHMADAPWSRPLAEQNALPMFQVRYEHTTHTAEGPQTEWRTSMFTGSIPGTIGELMDAVDGDAEQLADKYGSEHGGISSIQVMRV